MSAAEVQSFQHRPSVVDVENRRPPHDLDAEGAVLSCVMVDTDAMDQVADVLRPEHFYSEAHGRIFEASATLHGRGVPLDVVTVATELRDRDRLVQAGGVAYLTELLNVAPSMRVRVYATTVREKWVARRTILACQRATALGYTDYGSANEYINGISQELYEIASDQTTSSSDILGNLITKNFEVLAAAIKRGKSVTGLPTGLDRLDRLIAGLHDGELTIIAARPGMGKTSLALNIGVNVATADPGDGLAIFTLEMQKEELSKRMLCSEAAVDSAKMRSGLLTPADWSKLHDAAKRLHPLSIIIDDKSGLTITELRARLRRMAAEFLAKGKKLKLAIVDYIQLMNGTGDEGSREQVVSGISRGLKQIAKDLSIPIIALSQLNRVVESNAKDRRPNLSHLRESGAIEQDADNVCFIYRDDYYDKESEDRNIAELIVAKQRNGPVDTVRVRFDAQFTRFANLPEGGYDERGPN